MPTSDFFDAILKSTRARKDVLFDSKNKTMPINAFKVVFEETYERLTTLTSEVLLQNADNIARKKQITTSTNMFTLQIDLKQSDTIYITYKPPRKPHLQQELLTTPLHKITGENHFIDISINNTTLAHALAEYGRQSFINELHELLDKLTKIVTEKETTND